MDQELLVVTTAGDVLGHDEDVFCVVKHRMRSLHPNSCPSLVLPRQRYLAVPTRAPAQWEAPAPFKRDRVDRRLQLATTLEQMTEDWGPHFSYFRAAAALRELVHGHACPAVVPGWLGTVATPVVPAQRYSGNVYFGHLPNMSWRMLVNFQNQTSCAPTVPSAPTTEAHVARNCAHCCSLEN